MTLARWGWALTAVTYLRWELIPRQVKQVLAHLPNTRQFGGALFEDCRSAYLIPRRNYRFRPPPVVQVAAGPVP